MLLIVSCSSTCIVQVICDSTSLCILPSTEIWTCVSVYWLGLPLIKQLVSLSEATIHPTLLLKTVYYLCLKKPISEKNEHTYLICDFCECCVKDTRKMEGELFFDLLDLLGSWWVENYSYIFWRSVCLCVWIRASIVYIYIKVKQSGYTPWRRLGGEEV
jgi:hypothetical protein